MTICIKVWMGFISMGTTETKSVIVKSFQISSEAIINIYNFVNPYRVGQHILSILF